jgi:hypothetical protein
MASRSSSSHRRPERMRSRALTCAIVPVYPSAARADERKPSRMSVVTQLFAKLHFRRGRPSGHRDDEYRRAVRDIHRLRADTAREADRRGSRQTEGYAHVVGS